MFSTVEDIRIHVERYHEYHGSVQYRGIIFCHLRRHGTIISCVKKEVALLIVFHCKKTYS